MLTVVWDVIIIVRLAVSWLYQTPVHLERKRKEELNRI